MGARCALITGIAGQDGSYLAELLLEKGYEVHGLVHAKKATQEAAREAAQAAREAAPEAAQAAREASTGASAQLGCSEHLRGRLALLSGDLLDGASLRAAVEQVKPDELYHLAAPSFVPASWERPSRTIATIAGATATLLEAVRETSVETRVFVASSAAIFGKTPESPQHEETPCRPETPYATAKLAAHLLTGQFRAHHGLYACSGILYNHESERRPPQFVTRRITRAAASIKLGLEETVSLGDLHAVRDWSFAGDVMRGAWLMLQQDQPDDYVLASGVGHTVAELAEVAFRHVGLDARDHVKVDSGLQRGIEAAAPVGDPSRAREMLGWERAVGFEELIGGMVDYDLEGLEAARYGQ